MKDLIPLFRVDLIKKLEAAREEMFIEAERYYEKTLEKMAKDSTHLVYLCSPLKPTKQKLVQEHISEAITAASQILGAKYAGKKIAVFIPHLHLFSVYNEIVYPQTRERAIKFNDRIIRKYFHTLAVLGKKISKGMASEIEQAKKKGMEVVEMKDFKKQLKNLPDSGKSNLNYKKMINLHNGIHGQKFLIKQ
jgi:hypothetical protein